MKFAQDVIFAAGMAAPTASTPIAVQYDLLLVTFTFRQGDGIILDAEANMVCDITSSYLRTLLVGRCIYTDLPKILEQIQNTYLGLSQRALLVCMKDAYNKICERRSDLSLSGKGAVDKSHKAQYNNSCKVWQDGEMMEINQFPPNAICVVGLSKTGSRNPITKVHQSLVASMIVDPVSGRIYAAEFNTVCHLTNAFLTDLIVGRSLCTDLPQMIEEIQARYLGDSRRAIVSILKDAQNKLLTYMQSRDGQPPHTS